MFLSQTPQCFNCSFLSKLAFFFVACNLSLFYSVVRTTNSLVSFSTRSDHDTKCHHYLLVSSLIGNKISALSCLNAVFPRTIAGAIFFHTKRGKLFERRGIFEGDDYFKHCSLEFVCYIFCFILKPIRK